MVGNDPEPVTSGQRCDKINNLLIDLLVCVIAPAKGINLGRRVKVELWSDRLPELCHLQFADKRLLPERRVEHDAVERRWWQPQIELVGTKQGGGFLGRNNPSEIE